MKGWTQDDIDRLKGKKVNKRKFKNTPKIYKGVKYASTKEAKYAATLDLLIRAGQIYSWEYEPRFIFYAYGKRITSYKIDFKIIHLSGLVEYVEIKGGNATKTDAWRIRWKFLQAYLAEKEPEAKLTLKDD